MTRQQTLLWGIAAALAVLLGAVAWIKAGPLLEP